MITSFNTLFKVFIISFALNLLWEHLHVFLYAHYKGGIITEKILLHATLADALFTVGFALLFLVPSFLKKRMWLVIPLGFALSISIEKWALASGRWAYGSSMPIIPLINVGLTPAIQIGLLAYLTFYFVRLGKAKAGVAERSIKSII